MPWFLLLLAAPAMADAQDPSMTPDTFARMLTELSARLASGEPGQVPGVRVPAVWTVEAGGQRYEMPAGWLERRLRAARENPASWPAQRAALLEQLEALRLEAEGLSAGVGARGHVANDAARAALAGILARPEYRRMARQSALARLRARTLDWLARLLERLAGGPLGRRGTAVALAWILTAIAMIALAAWLSSILRRPDRRPGAFGMDGAGAHVKPARAWARDAVEAADARETVRCAYRAVVSGLEEEGAWRRDDARTPREYGRLLPEGHGRGSLFADVSRRFEEIWFGARTATDGDRAAALARLKELGCLPAD